MRAARSIGSQQADRVDWCRSGLCCNIILSFLIAVAFIASSIHLSAQSKTGTASLAVQVAPAVQVSTDGTNASVWIRLGTGGNGSLWGDSTSTCTAPISGAMSISASGKFTYALSTIPFVSDAFICVLDPGPPSSTANATWPHTPTSLAFGQEPTSAASGAHVTPPVTVKVLDSNGLLVTSSTASVTIAITSGAGTAGATLSGTLTQSAASGVATFNDLSIDKDGTGYTLRAASTGLTSATSSAFNITSGTAAKLAFIQQPSTTTAGSAIGPAVTVQVQDANGNVVTTDSSTVAIAISSGGVLSGGSTLSVAAVNGVATFSNLLPSKSGSYTLSATDGSLTSATSSNFTVSPASVSASVSTMSASPASVVADGSTTSTITVTLMDANSNPVSGKTVTLAQGGGSSSISAASGPSSSLGVVTFTVKDTKAEAVTYTATDTSDSLTLTQTPAVTFTAGALDHFKVENSGGGAIGTQTAGTAFNLRITAQDVNNNTVTSFTSTASLTSTGTLTGSPAPSGSFVAGVLDPQSVTITNTGSFTITATASGKTGTSAAFTVKAGSLNHFAIPAISSPQTAGTAFTISTITAQDVNNNTVTSFTSTVTYGGTAGVTGTSAAFTAGVLSNASVTPTVAGSNLSVTVTNGSATGSATIATVNPEAQTITVTTPAPSSAVYGSQFTVAATASSSLTVTYSSAGGCTNSGATFTMISGTTACTVKFDQAGNSSYGAAPEVTETVTAQKAALTVTGIAASNKVYDGATSATLNTGSAALVGVVSGDSGNVTLNTASAVGTFSDRSVGTSKTVTVSGLTISGTKASNYTLTQPTTTADITTKALTITGLTASARVYDGTMTEPLGGTAALLTAETAGSGTTSDGRPYSVDSVTTGGTAAGTLASKNVGTALSVTVTGVTISGIGSGNYTATQQTGLTANVTARPITVTAATNSKTYDGTTSAAATPTITSGTLATGDTANFSEAYSSKNVGTGLTLVPGGTVTDGNSGNNYSYTFVNNTTGVITARAITVTAATNSKTYDGTTSAAATPTITSGTLATGDTANFSEAYGNKNVGTGLTMTPTGAVTDGNSGNNYSVTFATNSTGVITVRAITVTAATNIKTYNGTTSAAATPTITSGTLASGDTANFTEAYSTKDAGSGNRTLVPNGTVSDGNSGNNYSYTFANNTTGTITAKALTMSGPTVPASKVYDGTTTATVSGTAVLQTAEAAGTGTTSDGKPYSADSVSLTGTATGAFNAKDVLSATTVTFTGVSLTGTGNTNYALTALTQSATITAKALTITGLTASNKLVDGGTTATITGTGALLSTEAAGSGTTSDGKPYTGDAVSVSGTPSGTFASSGAGTGITVNITASLTGAQASDYSPTQPTTTANIVDFSLSVAPSSVTKSKGNTYTNVYQITLTPSSGAIAGAVTLACASITGGGSEACSGFTFPNSPISVGTAGQVDVQIGTPAGYRGTYTITFQGSSGTITHNAGNTVTLIVQ